MTEITERHFCIDPGIGEKMDGCPYSLYEDGHDVQEYIIPPTGYKFIGFKYEPLSNQQIYDGKLVAQYEKQPFKARLLSSMGKVLMVLATLAILGLIVYLAASVFKEPKTNRPAKTPQTEVIVPDTLAEETPAVTTEEPQQVEEPVAPAEEPEAEPITEVKEEEKPVAEAPSTPFQKKFWDMIHKREGRMDPYDSLYKANRNQVEGEEYDYLRFTILKNSTAFKEWTSKLQKIPASELGTINTVNDLKSKLREIE